MTGEGEIRSDEVCLAAKDRAVQMEKCATKRPNPRQQFRYIPSSKQLVHLKSQFCLAIQSDTPALALVDCDPAGAQPTAKWELQNFSGGS